MNWWEYRMNELDESERVIVVSLRFLTFLFSKW